MCFEVKISKCQNIPGYFKIKLLIEVKVDVTSNVLQKRPKSNFAKLISSTNESNSLSKVNNIAINMTRKNIIIYSSVRGNLRVCVVSFSFHTSSNTMRILCIIKSVFPCVIIYQLTVTFWLLNLKKLDEVQWVLQFQTIPSFDFFSLVNFPFMHHWFLCITENIYDFNIIFLFQRKGITHNIFITIGPPNSYGIAVFHFMCNEM